VHCRVGVTRVLVNGVDQGLLILADRLHLTKNNAKTAAQLFHVTQLVKLHALLESLLLHDDVDELLLTVDANAELRVDILLPAHFVRAAENCRRNVEHRAVDLLRVFADSAFRQVVGVESHETVVAVIFSEALNAELKLGQTVVLRGELCARKEAEICSFRFLTGDAVRRGPQRLVRGGAVGTREAAESGDNGLDVWLDVTQVILVGERTLAENAEEGIASTSLARLRHANVFSQISDEVCVRVVDDEFAFCLSADEAVRQDDLALRSVLFDAGWRFGAHDLLSVDLNTHAANEVFSEISVKGRLKFLLANWQNVVEDSLPGVAVQGGAEIGAIVAAHIDPGLVSAWHDVGHFKQSFSRVHKLLLLLRHGSFLLHGLEVSARLEVVGLYSGHDLAHLAVYVLLM